MADDNIEIPERAIESDDVRRSGERARPRRKRRWGLILFMLLVVLPLALFALIAWITLSYSYSKGDRAGYQQKISRKGWLCKTWEGEIAQTAMPGAAPEIFSYTVRDDSIAQRLTELQGRRVSVTYEEHRFVPSSCFGDTRYFVTHVRTIEDPLMQGQVPGVPGAAPPPPQPAPPQTPQQTPTQTPQGAQPAQPAQPAPPPPPTKRP
ncbi:MAG: hypothetical protein ACJ8AO_09375 [Gemmatimonadaceae bacterium]